MSSKAKTVPSLETIRGLFDEIDEWYARVREIRAKLHHLPRGSEAYLDLLPDLLVEADVLKRKVEYAVQALEAFEEALPDD